jgi:hypothetical protein
MEGEGRGAARKEGQGVGIVGLGSVVGSPRDRSPLVFGRPAFWGIAETRALT